MLQLKNHFEMFSPSSVFRSRNALKTSGGEDTCCRVKASLLSVTLTSGTASEILLSIKKIQNKAVFLPRLLRTRQRTSLNTTSCFSRCLWVDGEASHSACQCVGLNIKRHPIMRLKGAGGERGDLLFAAHSREPAFMPQLGT